MKTLLSIFSFFASLNLLAQPVSFQSSLDTNRILIGEPITVKLEAEVARGSQFTWPMLPDTLSDIELLESSSLDTNIEGDRWKISQQLKVTAFDSGYFAVPPLLFTAADGEARSNAVPFMANFPKLEGEELDDIYAPLEADFNWWIVVLLVAAVIALAAGIYLLIRYLKRPKRSEPLAIEEKLTPYELAQKQLQELAEEKLAQKGQVKQYYSRLTDILRIYLYREMQVRAMESTPSEVAAQVQELNIDNDLKKKVADLMERTVMIKYAKEMPGEAFHESSMQTVKEFVERTYKPESQPEKEQV